LRLIRRVIGRQDYAWSSEDVGGPKEIVCVRNHPCQPSFRALDLGTQAARQLRIPSSLHGSSQRRGGGQTCEFRVRAGGHSIPEEVIRRRFQLGIQNLFSLYIPIADEWEIMDNSGPVPLTVAVGENWSSTIYDMEFFTKLREHCSNDSDEETVS
jgi:hypothetical protein